MIGLYLGLALFFSLFPAPFSFSFPSLKNIVTIGDIIEYPLPITCHGKTTGLAIVLECSEPLCVQPLCRREEDDGFFNEMVLIQDESQDSLLIASQDIVSIVRDVYFSQRPIEDRILNPHGEHSEDVYLIKTNELDLHRLFLSDE